MSPGHSAPVAMDTPDDTANEMQFMQLPIDIFITSILGIDYLVLLPIFIACARILHKNRKIQIFRSRRPLSLQYIVILTFIFTFIVQPLRLFDASLSNGRFQSYSYSIPEWISNSIEYCITLALLLLYGQRSYLIHYDFNYHEAILNNEWKQFTSKIQSQLDWYLKHRNKFGNFTFTLYIILIIWVLLSSALTLSGKTN